MTYHDLPYNDHMPNPTSVGFMISLGLPKKECETLVRCVCDTNCRGSTEWWWLLAILLTIYSICGYLYILTAVTSMTTFAVSPRRTRRPARQFKTMPYCTPKKPTKTGKISGCCCCNKNIPYFTLACLRRLYLSSSYILFRMSWGWSGPVRAAWGWFGACWAGWGGINTWLNTYLQTKGSRKEPTSRKPSCWVC